MSELSKADLWQLSCDLREWMRKAERAGCSQELIDALKRGADRTLSDAERAGK